MPPRSSVPAILGLFVASLALRPQLLAIGPLLPIIRTYLRPSHGGAGPALDWRHSLTVLSVAGLVPVVAWLILVRSDGPGQRSSAAVPRLPWRSRTGWILVAAFGIQSLVYYGLVSWLPNVYVERGW